MCTGGNLREPDQSRETHCLRMVDVAITYSNSRTLASAEYRRSEEEVN